MSDPRLVGQSGEDLAAKYLSALGYKIRGRNVRFGRLEIDMIAYDPKEKMMVFVEVKSRTKITRYPIRTAVDRRKRQAMRKAVNKWVLKNGYEGPGRIDVLCVGENKVVDHVVDFGSEVY